MWHFRFLLLAFMMMSAAVHAKEMKHMQVTVYRNSKGALKFKLERGASFTDIDDFAKYCSAIWGRGTQIGTNNVVDIHYQVPLSAEDRQYIADRFLPAHVYPAKLYWKEDGEERTATYRPDENQWRNWDTKRELK